ncbi:hypothetical protein J6590_038475 [Homalodisca vitripennis]|nr:hypothetical protein J6590_038475 [Homalodisca vitripennis]
MYWWSLILHHPPARDPRKKRLRREGYVRNRASLPGAPESRRVALVEDDEPGPGDEVQDVFPPGVGRGHSPLDGPRVEITANDNVPSGAEHALLQTINLVYSDRLRREGDTEGRQQLGDGEAIARGRQIF